MTPTKIAMGGAGIFALLFTFAIQRIPAPAEAINLRATPTHETTDPIPYETKVDALRKAYIADQPRVIPIERILLDPQPTMPTPPLTPSPTQQVVHYVPPSPAPRQGKDVCARHGRHKVLTRGGKSWRCQR
jgi:hypothetical protein